MKASDLFVRCLENEGVEYVFGVPGEENLDLVESLRGSSIRFVLCRHEQHAAFMAANHGRLTGKAGVVLSTLGPGATNLVTGIAYAQLGGMPLVALTGQKPILDNRQGTFQVIDVCGTFEPLTKWTRSIVSPRTIPRCVRYAFRVAEEERPGATHLELPEDIAGMDVDATAVARPRPRRPVPDDKAVRLALDMLREARNPLLLISGGGNRKQVGKQILRFVEQTGAYAVCTQLGKGVLPEDHPRSLFCLGIHKRDHVALALDRADLVVTVGYDIVEYPPAVWNRGKDKRVLHVDFTPPEPDEFYDPDLSVVGDIGNSFWRFNEELGPVRYDNAWLEGFRAKVAELLFEHSCESRFPLLPQRVVRDVRAVMGREDVISLDNGIYKLWFARLYPAYAENTVLLDNALATMGAGLAGAMAAKLVHPERRVLAVCGDGGFMMNSQDLETAVRLGLDVKVLILRDDAYGFIAWKQQSEGFPRFAMDFGNPDFVRYAEAYGIPGLRVTEADGLAPALERAFTTAGPVLVECAIDYSANERLSEDLAARMEHLLG
ncbi:MAG: acetolactate synthase large subunit [Planctomycetota bacterium]